MAAAGARAAVGRRCERRTLDRTERCSDGCTGQTRIDRDGAVWGNREREGMRCKAGQGASKFVDVGTRVQRRQMAEGGGRRTTLTIPAHESCSTESAHPRGLHTCGAECNGASVHRCARRKSLLWMRRCINYCVSGAGILCVAILTLGAKVI